MLSDTASAMPGRTADSTASVPRRRARKDASDTGTLTVTQPRRKRPKLADDTFVPPEAEDEVESVKQEETSSPINGHNSTNSVTSRLSIPHRGRSSTKPRQTLPNALFLTKNPNYDIQQSRSFPGELQAASAKEFQGSFSSSHGSALALTKDKALVWDYTSQSTTTHVLQLPNPSRTGDPLPLGCLVPGSSPSELGLMVVAPTSGKITYWDNVQDAHALGLFSHKRNGVDGSLGSLFSGEKVARIEPIGQAGYICILSTGRVAHVTLRDIRSQPTVNANFLRAPSQQNGGGIFGSLKKAFIGAGWLRDTVAAKSRPSEVRGHVDVVVMNESASFQTWQLGWSGQNSFGWEVHAQAGLALFVQTQLPGCGPDCSVKALDFALLPSSSASNHQVLVLIAISTQSFSTLALVHLALKDDSADALTLIKLDSYVAPLENNESWKPAVIISDTGNTAFVVLERAVVLVGIESLGKGTQEWIFQDTVYLKEDEDSNILGAGTSAAVSRNAVQLLVQGYGILSIAALVGSNEHEPRRTRVTAKDKIEQVIFYSMVTKSPLNLSKTIDTKSTKGEVEAAALKISLEIITSRSPHMAKSTASVSHDLKLRADLLEHLAQHLRNGYPVLSRVTRWELRWNAEKLAAAQKVWTRYDYALRNAGDDDKGQLLDDVTHNFFERGISDYDEHFEPDFTRQWFYREVDKMTFLFAGFMNEVEDLFQKNPGASSSYTALVAINQCSETAIDIYETAWTFRTNNAWLYNLEGESIEDDVLQDDYTDLPEFWTSTMDANQKLVQLPEDGAKIAIDQYDKAEEGSNVAKLSQKICKEIGQVVDLALKSCVEKIYFCRDKPWDKPTLVHGTELQEWYERKRLILISQLAQVGMSNQALNIAQKYHDLKSLSYIVREESKYMVETVASETATTAEKRKANETIARLEDLVRSFFKKYGDSWAEEFYQNHLESKTYAGLLDQSSAYRSEITSFLRAKPSRRKLSWINDVLSEKDYKSATKTLTGIAVSQESDLWSKKVELSLAKLASLAIKKGKAQVAKEKLAESSSNEWNDLPSEMASVQVRDQDSGVDPDEALKLVRIEQQLYDHIAPSLQKAIDEAAELQLAMESFGQKFIEHRPNLRTLLREGMSNLVGRAVLDAEQLIDVLTLMDIRPSNSAEEDIGGWEISLALDTLKHSGLAKRDQNKYEMLLGTIWRRCFLKDNWEEINAASQEGRSDLDIEDELASTVLYQTLAQGHDSSLFSAPDAIPILEPTSDLVTSAGTKPADHAARFKSDELARPIAIDNAAEADRLRVTNETCRLRHWFDAAVDLVHRTQQDRLEEQEQRKREGSEMAQSILGDEQGHELVSRRAPSGFDHHNVEEMQE